MLSLSDPALPEPCPAPFNLARHVLAAAEERPDRIALQVLGPAGAERWSYARLAAAVRGVATGLLDRGLRPGDRVLLRLGNGVAFPLAFLGAVTAGLVPVPTAAGLTAGEVAKLCAAIAPSLIIAGDGVALPAAPPCPVLPEADLHGFEARPPADWAMGDPERLAYVVFTSGTSGSPRAVAHAHRAVWARRMMRGGWHGIGPDDRLLHAGALNWTYTLGVGLFDPWTAGATAMVAGDGVGADQLPLLARRFDATIFAAVPGVYRRILADHPRLSLPRLRHGLSAGEKLPPALRQAWRAATGTDLHEAMGMSECSTFLSSSPPGPRPRAPPAIRSPAGVSRCSTPRASPCRVANRASLRCTGAIRACFLGCVEGETISAVTGEWFQTGDMVVMAAEGAVTSLGRADDMINAGGFRVSPAEIEAELATHPGVTACAAVELPVKADATVIAAFYAGDADEASLAAHAAAFLARYKQPRLYLRCAAIPVTANGKINRRALREEWKASQ